MKEGMVIPKVTFRTRIGDEVETDGGCAIGGQWINKTTDDYFKGKRVVLFSLPGAFTPTCSSQQLPGFEKLYEEIKQKGIDDPRGKLFYEYILLDNFKATKKKLKAELFFSI